jgi:hypothetical protein
MAGPSDEKKEQIKDDVKQKLSNLKDQIVDTLHDSVTLEVSSMLVDGISGRKMPDSKIAFFEVVKAWAVDVGQVQTELQNKKVQLSDQQLGCFALIDTISDAPNPKALKVGEQNLIVTVNEQIDWDQLRQSVISSIAKSQEQLQQNLLASLHQLERKQVRIFNLYNEIFDEIKADKSLTFKDKQELRKMWELKDGYIFAQNTVQLDGDVLAKYNSRLFRDKAIKDKTDILIELHQNNVATGIKQWRFIFNTISEAVRAISSFGKVG